MADKENLEPRIPSKRRRLSLSRKKVTNDSRFAVPVNPDELKAAAQGVVPENTRRRNNWAEKNLKEWAASRSTLMPNEPVPNLLECRDPSEFNKWLCRYVLETRQENGKPYPPKSLYNLLCGIQRITRDDSIDFNKNYVRFQLTISQNDGFCL